MDKDYSFDALVSFLENGANRGHFKIATANAMKASCNKVLGILNESELTDLSKVDLDNTFERFMNINGSALSADSYKTYKSRVNKAVNEFIAFTNNPASWKPSLATRIRKSKNQGETSETVMHKAQNPTPQSGDATFAHQYPLRGGTINISGLPRDLKLAEAKRLGAFLQTLCEDFEPDA